MGKALTGAKIRGVAVQDTRFKPDNLTAQGANPTTTTNASYNTSEPRPGSAVPSDPLSNTIIGTSNAQENTLTLSVERGGNLGINKARFRYKTDTSEVRSWIQPNFPMGFHRIEDNTTYNFDYFDLLYDLDTREPILLAAANNVADANYTVRQYKYDSTDESWTASSVVTLYGYSSETGPIACYTIPGTNRKVFVTQSFSRYSDDNGVTWNEYGRHEIQHSTDKFRAKATIDEVLLVAFDENTGKLYQYASNDQGMNYTFIEEKTIKTVNIGGGVLALKSGKFMVLYLGVTTSFPKYVVLGSAFDKVSEQTEGDISGATGYTVDGYVDDDGTVYVFVTGGGDKDMSIYYSIDEGENWTEYNDNLFNTSDSNNYMNNVAVCQGPGNAFLVSNWQKDSGTALRQMFVMNLGGWSNVGFQPRRGVDFVERLPENEPGIDQVTGGVGWGVTDLPNNTGWTRATTGSPTVNLTDELEITTGLSDTSSYYVTNNATNSIFAIFKTRWTGGSSAGLTSGISLRAAATSPAYEYQIDIWFDTGLFKVYDRHLGGGSGTQIGTTQNATFSNTTYLLLAIDIADVATTPEAIARVYWKQNLEDDWTIAVDNVSLTKVAVNTTNRIEWGAIAAAVASSYWKMVAYGEDASVCPGHLSVELENRAMGKPLSRLPYPAPDVGKPTKRGFLLANGGPVAMEETFTISPSHDYSINNIFPQVSPSPKATWRSKDKTAQHIPIDLGEDSAVGNDEILAFGLFNINFTRSVLYYWNGSAWSIAKNLIPFNGSLGLSFVRTGNVLSPDTGATIDAGRFIQENEYAGGTVRFSTGEIYKIKSNSSGGWSQTAGTKPMFILEGVVGGTPTSGTCDIYHNHITTLVLPRVNARYWKLEINQAGPAYSADSYFEIGTMFIGALKVFGKQWSDGWTQEVAGNISKYLDVHGTERRKQLGPEKRAITLNWQDAVNLAYQRASLTPDYIEASGSLAVAAQDDVWGKLKGLLQLSEGGSVPCLLFTDASDGDVGISDEEQYLYCYMSETLGTSHVTGDELTKELLRVDALRFEEIV